MTGSIFLHLYICQQLHLGETNQSFNPDEMKCIQCLGIVSALALEGGVETGLAMRCLVTGDMCGVPGVISDVTDQRPGRTFLSLTTNKRWPAQVTPGYNELGVIQIILFIQFPQIVNKLTLGCVSVHFNSLCDVLPNAFYEKLKVIKLK